MEHVMQEEKVISKSDEKASSSELPRSCDSSEKETQELRDLVLSLKNLLDKEIFTTLQCRIKIGEYEDKIALQDNLLVKAETQVNELQSRVSTLTESNDVLEEQLKNLKEEFSQAQELIPNLRKMVIASEVEINDKLKKAKAEAAEEFLQELLVVQNNHIAQVEEILTKQSMEYDCLKTTHDEIVASKTRLEEENGNLKRAMGQLKRDNLDYYHHIRRIETTLDWVDRREEKLKRDGKFASAVRNTTDILTPSKFSTFITESGCFPFRWEDQDEFQFNFSNTVDPEEVKVPGPLPLELDDSNRFAELYRRNLKLPSHLKSCYPSELIACKDEKVTELHLKGSPSRSTAQPATVLGTRRLKPSSDLRTHCLFNSPNPKRFQSPIPKKISA